MVKVLAQIGLALVIVTATYYAIVRVAEEKAAALADGDVYVLDRQGGWAASLRSTL